MGNEMKRTLRGLTLKVLEAVLVDSLKDCLLDIIAMISSIF